MRSIAKMVLLFSLIPRASAGDQLTGGIPNVASTLSNLTQSDSLRIEYLITPAPGANFTTATWIGPKIQDQGPTTTKSSVCHIKRSFPNIVTWTQESGTLTVLPGPLSGAAPYHKIPSTSKLTIGPSALEVSGTVEVVDNQFFTWRSRIERLGSEYYQYRLDLQNNTVGTLTLDLNQFGHTTVTLTAGSQPFSIVLYKTTSSGTATLFDKETHFRFTFPFMSTSSIGAIQQTQDMLIPLTSLEPDDPAVATAFPMTSRTAVQMGGAILVTLLLGALLTRRRSRSALRT